MKERKSLREWVHNNIVLDKELLEFERIKLRERISNYYIEGFTKEEIEKMVEVGMETAKDVHGEEFDPNKAEKVIRGIINKGIDKGMSAKDISGWIQNAFREEE